MQVHPMALVHPSVVLPKRGVIGPFAIVDHDVLLSEGVELGPHCHLYPGTRLGEYVKVWDGAVIGSEPQDLKFRGEHTETFVGARTRIREYATIHRGTSAAGVTRIGEDCFIMAYCHVAHDCELGRFVQVANAVQFGGHVRIGDHAVISGMTGVHQFTTIGAGAYVGGGLRLDRDVPPFSKAMGEPVVWAGVNERGLFRAGFGREGRSCFARWMRQLWASGPSDFLEAIPRLDAECSYDPDRRLLGILREFLMQRQRGLVSPRKSVKTSFDVSADDRLQVEG